MDIAGLRFLVVEDHDFQRRMALRLLSDLGAKDVAEAANGRLALDWLRRQGEQIDIAVVDLDMPEMDGIELIRHAAELRLSRAVIIASGLEPAMLHSVETMARGYGLQVLGNVEKPLTRERLFSLISFYQPVTQPRLAHAALPLVKQDVLEGLEAGEFFPVYQPKVQFVSGQLVGVEALVRWSRPGGAVSPSVFIPLIEQEGYVDHLTDFMITRAAQQRVLWAGHGMEVNTAVNISVLSLTDVSLADHYESLVRAVGADPRGITLELTETALMTEAAKALDVLTRLRLKGFGLAIDDFGTGYSSLQQLHRVPFTELKIDQGFVRGSPDHPRRQTIVLGSIDLGRRLKLRTVAEGVETRAEWDLLKGLGCDVAQGYYLSRPLLPEDFLDWAASWRAMVE